MNKSDDSKSNNTSNTPKKKKKLGSLNTSLIIVVILFIVFNQQMIELYKTYGTMPETYACAIVAALLGEAGLCGMIARTKIKYKDKELDAQFKEDHPELSKDENKDEDEILDLNE